MQATPTPLILVVVSMTIIRSSLITTVDLKTLLLSLLLNYNNSLICLLGK